MDYGRINYFFIIIHLITIKMVLNSIKLIKYFINLLINYIFFSKSKQEYNATIKNLTYTRFFIHRYLGLINSHGSGCSWGNKIGTILS